MRAGGMVSFDNLAIEQLDVRGWVMSATWETHYLGADDSHTLYIDAVRMEYAESSVSLRQTVGGLGVRAMFSRIRNSIA